MYVPKMESTTLHGYKRYGVKDQVYPAITKAEGTSEVQGVLLREISEEAMRVLDKFEGDEYKKETVSVKTSSGPTIANVYVWAKAPERLAGDWSLDQFKENHLGNYLERLKKNKHH